MFKIIHRLLLELDEKTLIWPGHEYTLNNLEFGSMMDPDNHALKVRYYQAKQSRSNSISTVPSSWKYELMTNPFLRIDSRSRDEGLWINIQNLSHSKNLVLDEELTQSVRLKMLSLTDAEEVIMLASLRSLKDNWNPI